MSEIPEDLKEQYEHLQRQMIGSKSQARQAKPIAGLIERIAALTADRDAWRERHDVKEAMRLEDEATIARLSAPVSDAEWQKFRTVAKLDGCDLSDEFTYRDEVNAIIAARLDGVK